MTTKRPLRNVILNLNTSRDADILAFLEEIKQETTLAPFFRALLRDYISRNKNHLVININIPLVNKEGGQKKTVLVQFHKDRDEDILSFLDLAKQELSLTTLFRALIRDFMKNNTGHLNLAFNLPS